MIKTVAGLKPNTSNKHGFSTHPCYRVWINMHDRCYNSNHKSYERYGGRGISVCDRWFEFLNFVEDMGVRTQGMTLDRINNDQGYKPSNCRWTSQKVQIKNRSIAVNLTCCGETKTLLEWSQDDRCEVSYDTLHNRLSIGWSEERAILTPKRKYMDKLYL